MLWRCPRGREKRAFSIILMSHVFHKSSGFFTCMEYKKPLFDLPNISWLVDYKLLLLTAHHSAEAVNNFNCFIPCLHILRLFSKVKLNMMNCALILVVMISTFCGLLGWHKRVLWRIQREAEMSTSDRQHSIRPSASLPWWFPLSILMEAKGPDLALA